MLPPFRIVFLGPPGSGKGTQAQALHRIFSVVPLSTGEVLRGAVEQKTPLGVSVAETIREGRLVSDELMNEMIEQRLLEKDCLENGYVLDGYPRTLPQARALDAILSKAGFSLDHVFLFELDDAIALERVNARAAACAKTQKVRSDDNDAVSRKRLKIYHSMIGEIVAYYRERGILSPIDVSGQPGEVTGHIVEIIKGEKA